MGGGGGGAKSCINDLGYMIKIATMTINGKNNFEIFSGTRRPVILKRGMKHCKRINHDPLMTLTYFTASQRRSHIQKTFKMPLKDKTFRKYGQISSERLQGHWSSVTI